MTIIKHIINSLLCFALSISIHAQSPATDEMTSHTTAETYYKYYLQGEGGVDYLITNTAFKNSFSGVYQVYLSGGFYMVKNLFAGIELHGSQYGTGNGITSAFDIHLIDYDAGIRAGYCPSMTKDFLFCYSLCFGQSLLVYNSVPGQAPKGGFHNYSYFFDPSIFIGYKVTDQLHIGLQVYYTFCTYVFNPSYVNLSSVIQYGTNDSKGMTNFLNWGFGLFYAIEEKK